MDDEVAAILAANAGIGLDYFTSELKARNVLPLSVDAADRFEILGAFRAAQICCSDSDIPSLGELSATLSDFPKQVNIV